MRSMARSSRSATTIFLLFVLLLLMMAVAEGATRRREIIVACEDLKIVFEIPEKAKWSMRLATDKKSYNCQIVGNSHARR
jgi:hypothetical protein